MLQITSQLLHHAIVMDRKSAELRFIAADQAHLKAKRSKLYDSIWAAASVDEDDEVVDEMKNINITQDFLERKERTVHHDQAHDDTNYDYMAGEEHEDYSASYNDTIEEEICDDEVSDQESPEAHEYTRTEYDQVVVERDHVWYLRVVAGVKLEQTEKRLREEKESKDALLARIAELKTNEEFLRKQLSQLRSENASLEGAMSKLTGNMAAVKLGGGGQGGEAIETEEILKPGNKRYAAYKLRKYVLFHAVEAVC